MPKCELCGKEVVLPFTCAYCGEKYCAEHRLPENHNCSNIPKTPPMYLSPTIPEKEPSHAVKPVPMIQKSSWTRKVSALLITLVLVLLAAYFLSNYLISPSPAPTISPTTSPVALPIAITGRVVSVVGGSVVGENVSGVEIRVIDFRGNEVMTNKTDVMGCFSFSNMPRDTYIVKVTVPYGYVARSDTSYVVAYSRDVEFKLENLLVKPKKVFYKYTLRGVSSEIAFSVYEGMYNYLVSMEDSTVSYVTQEPSDEEISRTLNLRYINENIEMHELRNLVGAIEQITPNEDDQARIAISLVQNIPYGQASTDNYDWAYPYEILYLNKGVCSEKSRLLVCLLRELGYGCSILEFTSQNHAAVGIACPSQYAYYSGYAFVESTSPTIITYLYGDYVEAGKLPSTPSYAIVVQDGKSMNSISEEYQDAQTYLSLINMGPVLDEVHYTLWQDLVNKYGIQVS
jgi:hypothetical protein